MDTARGCVQEDVNVVPNEGHALTQDLLMSLLFLTVETRTRKEK